ncbi:MAG: alcohol dehydrogenase catalytic domain-containing protein [Candidatus Thermoplasmatota archaeon]|nr:alcohol dehydrogenase catalytic domain-containing protein [Candidatus Thermoplasmatota archaeon]
MKAITTIPPGGGVKLSQVSLENTKGVRVKTYRTGICGTDKEIAQGKLTFARPEIGSSLVMGHEAVGIIAESVEDSTFKEGDIVVPMVRRPGGCRMCRLGRQDYCEDGDFVEAGIRGKNGFMREEFIDDPRFLVKVDNPSIRDLAVLTEPLKNVMKMEETFQFLRTRIPWYCEDSTLSCKNMYVFGTGTEGLLISIVFKSLGMNVVAVNRHPLSENVMDFLDRNRIDYLDTSSEKLDAKVKDLPMDAAIDAVGAMDVLKEITDNVSNNGIAIMFGTSGQLPSHNFDVLERIVDRNIVVVGSVDGAKNHYAEAIDFIETHGKAMQMDRIITGKYQPEELNIFTEKEKGEIKKVIAWS